MGSGETGWARNPLEMNRGDIWHVDLDPVEGREQAGERFVLIVSPNAYNRRLGVPLCVPITGGGSFARNQGFAVTLMGAGTQTTGVILCNQLRTLDLQARGAKFRERVPDHIMHEVLAKLETLLQ